jgi:uncharacterized protein YidB (DUF937 family)
LISRWRYALVVGVVLGLVGAGVAWAGLGDGGSSDRDIVVNDVAKRLGISSDKLKQAIQDALAARVDAAVKDGRLTKDQAQEIKRHVRSGGGIGLGPLAFGRPGFGHRGPPGPPLAGAAEFLGLTPAELFARIQHGKSLADVAKEKGKSSEELERAMLDSAREQLDKGVKDKVLTEAQRKEMLKRLETDLPKIIERKWPSGRGFRFKAPGPGLPPGFGPDHPRRFEPGHPDRFGEPPMM